MQNYNVLHAPLTAHDLLDSYFTIKNTSSFLIKIVDLLSTMYGTN